MEATEIRSARPMPEMILRITETGREITDTPEAPANRVDLADIRAWRFFRACLIIWLKRDFDMAPLRVSTRSDISNTRLK